MDSEAAILDALLSGTLWSASRTLPLTLHTRLGDLRPRFIPKGHIGRSYRAIARNGRVLLASDESLAELAGKRVRLRLQTWHKAILPGERPQPYGILLAIRAQGPETDSAIYAAELAVASNAAAVLAVDVGGGLRLEFRADG